MSSLRNAVSRRAHKERAQPQARKKFGLLEKHKDYVVRANAYHKKEEALRKLMEKAAFRNPDEFYFKMSKTKTVDGVHKPEKTAASYRELEARKSRVNDLEKLYMEMTLKKELQKKDRKRKLREDEMNSPTSKPVYKWRTEKKR